MNDKSKTPGATGLMVLGIVMVAFGTVSIASPLVAGTALVWIVGVLLLTTGVVQLVSGLREASWSSKLPSLILGVITLAAGTGLLVDKWRGLAILTLILAISFVAEGIWKIVASLSYRPANGWVGLLLSGLVTLVLGWMIWSEWPWSGEWAIGVLVGFNLLMTGISMIFLATTIKKLARLTAQDAAPPADTETAGS